MGRVTGISLLSRKKDVFFKVGLGCLGALFFSYCWSLETDIQKYAVYYGSEADSNDLANYQLLVLDRYHPPPFRSLQNNGTLVLGYLSVGEIAQHDYFFEQAKGKGWLGSENVSWPGRYIVDLRNLAWQKFIIEEQIPKILRRGFDGVFLDTLDSPLFLSKQQPEQYTGMQLAALSIVQAIRKHYPKILIMQNRGYEILPDSAGWIDFFMAESFYSVYDAETKTYRKTGAEDYRWALDRIKLVQKAHPDVKILTLDYWQPNDLKMIADIYRTQRKQGFIPYVATQYLDRLVPE